MFDNIANNENSDLVSFASQVYNSHNKINNSNILTVQWEASIVYINLLEASKPYNPILSEMF